MGVYIGQTLVRVPVPSSESHPSAEHPNDCQFILLSPCAFLAQDYMLLPRLANWLAAPELLLLKPSIIVRVFVISDVSTFLIQAAGGGMSAMSGSMAKAGDKVGFIELRVARWHGDMTDDCFLRLMNADLARWRYRPRCLFRSLRRSSPIIRLQSVSVSLSSPRCPRRTG